jgi:hypothetical protein
LYGPRGSMGASNFEAFEPWLMSGWPIEHTGWHACSGGTPIRHVAKAAASSSQGLRERKLWRFAGQKIGTLLPTHEPLVRGTGRPEEPSMTGWRPSGSGPTTRRKRAGIPDLSSGTGLHAEAIPGANQGNIESMSLTGYSLGSCTSAALTSLYDRIHGEADGRNCQLASRDEGWECRPQLLGTLQPVLTGIHQSS